MGKSAPTINGVQGMKNKAYIVLLLSRLFNFLVLDKLLFHKKVIFNSFKLQQAKLAFRCGKNCLPNETPKYENNVEVDRDSEYNSAGM